MTDRMITCPRCGSSAVATVEVVPTMGDAGLAVVAYSCPTGCPYDQLSDAVDAELGIRRGLG